MRFQRIETILKDSFHSGFLLWEQTLSNKMGLQIRPLSSQELWQTIWDQFNQTTPPEIPYLIALDEQGLREKATSDFHIRHLLIEKEASLPFLDRAWVKLQNHYIGTMIFSEKPGGLGTPEWYDTPTLQDFYNYCSPGYINLDAITNNSKEILASLDQIRLRLRF